MKPRQVLCFVCVAVQVLLQTSMVSATATTVTQRANAILDHAESTGDFLTAALQASALFDQVAVWGHAANGELFLEAAFANRLLTQLAQAEGIDRVALLKYLRANPEFARAIAFLVRPGDDPKEVYTLVDRFRLERGDDLNDYAMLTAALCVVHEKPLQRRVNENEVKAVDPIKLFDYYKAHEKRMLFGVRHVPAELLVYVVDSTTTIEEMRWALKQYAGHQAVGKLFFSIQYDQSHFRQGSQKKVTAEGYNLPNILRYGGVCADQAYFAVSVGKSIGVPTTYTRGRSSQVSHAWVGYLQARDQRAKWNFNEGRYSVYQGVRGVVVDPQTGALIPDSVVSLLGEMIGYSHEAYHTAVSLVDAVATLRQAHMDNSTYALPRLETNNARKQARGTDKASRLELLEAGLRRNPGYAVGWYVLAQMASDGELSLADKKRWSNVLMKLCGDKYPDFTLAILGPMIETISDPKEQDKIWTAAGELFTRRKDLSAEILMSRGRLWMDQGKTERAGRYYMQVVERYVNDGPFVLAALDEIEKILREAGQTEKILLMYNQTWMRVHVPGRMAPTFRRQSNWYKIGHRYAKRLEEFGHAQQADQARTKIKQQVGS